MVSIPAVTPVTIPDKEPTVACPLLALHVPPGVRSLNAIVAPVQTVFGPAIGAGLGLTVTVLPQGHVQQ